MLEGRSGAYTPPNQGESMWLAGDRITVKLASEATSGVYSMVEEVTPPQGGPPPYVHSNEDEALYVLEGEVEFLLGEETIPAGAGSCAYAPREPAPEGSSPPEGEPDVERIMSLAAKYDVEIPPPPDL